MLLQIFGKTLDFGEILSMFRKLETDGTGICFILNIFKQSLPDVAICSLYYIPQWHLTICLELTHYNYY